MVFTSYSEVNTLMKKFILQTEDVLKDNILEPFIPDYNEEIKGEKWLIKTSKKATDCHLTY